MITKENVQYIYRSMLVTERLRRKNMTVENCNKSARVWQQRSLRSALGTILLGVVSQRSFRDERSVSFTFLYAAIPKIDSINFT
ncbi:hypothetical protein H6G17_31370 [Chroococcidiopsis sp. FACHB-1243]|nr:hypothetical protein [Chroococcidiopsis sp. [FACHB-1243]]